MQSVFTALIPIFALILLGFVLRQRRLLADAFWLPCETLNYYYMFPALMFSQVARANLTQFPIRPIAIAILGAVGAGALLLYGWRLWSRQPGAVFSSVIQGSLRPNTYVGVAAAAAMYGSVGLTLTSISIAVAIPLLNVASVVILMRYGSGGAPTPRQILNAVLKNPVIMAVLLGALFNLSGLALPATLSSLLSSSARPPCRWGCWPSAPGSTCRRPARRAGRCCSPPSSSCCWCRC